jgi:hypothetical protein
MWRRVVRKDLWTSIPDSAHRKLHHPFLWIVYGDYERISATSADSYFVATNDRTNGPPRVYEPIKDEPYLFLKFAKLVESNDQERALETWISAYGLLGLHRNLDSDSRVGFWDISQFRLKEGSQHTVTSNLFEFSDAGGEGETVGSLREEALTANETLIFYEAAMSEDRNALEHVMMRGSEDSIETLRAYCQLRMEESGGSYLNALTHLAAERVFWNIQDALEQFTYPCISIDLEARHRLDPRAHFTVDQFYRSCQPRNLLGAIYLQAYWLVTSTADLSKCKYCGHIISYATVIPDSRDNTRRKPRRDKVFCNSRCRQNYHYHNRIKPARQD